MGRAHLVSDHRGTDAFKHHADGKKATPHGAPMTAGERDGAPEVSGSRCDA